MALFVPDQWGQQFINLERASAIGVEKKRQPDGVPLEREEWVVLVKSGGRTFLAATRETREEAVELAAKVANEANGGGDNNTFSIKEIVERG